MSDGCSTWCARTCATSPAIAPRAARRSTGAIWLNANESPWPNRRRCRRAACAAIRSRSRARCASAWRSCTAARRSSCWSAAAATRASTCWCARSAVPGSDAVVDHAADLRHVRGLRALAGRARCVEVPLRDGAGGFALRLRRRRRCRAGAAAREAGVPVLAGQSRPASRCRWTTSPRWPTRLQGRALVVVDEAYVEYADAPSAVTLLVDATRTSRCCARCRRRTRWPRARIGCVIADADADRGAAQRCQAPYPLPAPCVAAGAGARWRRRRCAARAQRIAATVRRARRAAAGAGGVARRAPRLSVAGATSCWCASTMPQRAFERLLAAGIVVRDMRAMPGLGDALRISIGTPEQNDARARARWPQPEAA